MSQRAEKRMRVAACVMLAGLTFALYSGVGRYEFTTLDDRDYITGNPDVTAGLSWNGIVWAFTSAYSSNWHPLTWISHMLDCQLFGLNAGVHHLENAVIHIVNTLLLLAFLNRTTKAFWHSTFVASLFALHPAHVESVAWISERKDVLSTFFFLLTLLAYNEYVAGRKLNTGGQAVFSMWRRHSPSMFYILSLALFAMGLLSKPMVVTLPFVLVLIDYWPLQRFQLSGIKTIGAQDWLSLLKEKSLFLILSFVSCVLTIWAQDKGHSIASLAKIPLWNRVVHAVVSYSSYLGKLFWPTKLAVCYPLPSGTEYGLATISALVLTGISIMAVTWRNSRPYFLTGWLWYILTLLPVIGFVQVGEQALADRYTYIPSIGVFIVLSWLLAEMTERLKAGGGVRIQQRAASARVIFAGLSILLLSACTLRSHTQIKTWRNTKTLFEHALEVTDGNFMAHTGLGALLVREGNLKEAMEHLKRSIELNPTYPTTLLEPGNALYENGQKTEGIEYLKKLMAVARDDPEAIDTYALVLMKEKDFSEAERFFQEALAIRPNFPEAHAHLAGLLEQQGRWAEAVGHYDAAIRLKPGAADLHLYYANGLLKRKRLDEAMQQYRDALGIRPNYLEAQLGMASALIENNNLEEAGKYYAAIVANCPTNDIALDGLGYTLAVRGKSEEAYSYFLKAITIRPSNSFAQLHVGMELGRRGASAEAVAHYRLAIKYGNDLPLAMNNLAWMLATHPSADIRNGTEAVELAEKACRITKETQSVLIDR